MKKVILHGKNKRQDFAIVDDDTYEVVNKLRWHVKKSPSSEYVVGSVPIGMEVPFRVINTYVVNKNKDGTFKRIDIRKTYMHWVVISPPDGLMIDHINHDTYDNRRENLRIVTRAENRKNSKDVAQSFRAY